MDALTFLTVLLDDGVGVWLRLLQLLSTVIALAAAYVPTVRISTRLAMGGFAGMLALSTLEGVLACVLKDAWLASAGVTSPFVLFFYAFIQGWLVYPFGRLLLVACGYAFVRSPLGRDWLAVRRWRLVAAIVTTVMVLVGLLVPVDRQFKAAAQTLVDLQTQRGELPQWLPHREPHLAGTVSSALPDRAALQQMSDEIRRKYGGNWPFEVDESLHEAVVAPYVGQSERIRESLHCGTCGVHSSWSIFARGFTLESWLKAFEFGIEAELT